VGFLSIDHYYPAIMPPHVSNIAAEVGVVGLDDPVGYCSAINLDFESKLDVNMSVPKRFGFAVEGSNGSDSSVDGPGCDFMCVTVCIDVSHRTVQQFADRRDDLRCIIH
jgi:hypothetical protein